MKKLALLVALLTLLPFGVQAYTVSVEGVNTTVPEGGSLHYKITIFNDQPFDDTVWFFDLIDTALFNTRYSSTRVNLEPGANETVDFYVDSTPDTPLLIEIPFKIYFNNPSGSAKDVTLKGKFLKTSDLRPVITASSFPQTVDPRLEQKLLLGVYNPSSSFVDSIIRFEVLKDGVKVFNGSQTERLEPLATNSFVVKVNFNPKQAPGNYVIRYRAYNKDYAFEWNETSFEIIGFEDYSVSEPLVKQGLIGKTISFNVTNAGTSEGEFLLPLKASPLERLFGYYHEGDVRVEDSNLVFSALLQPGETAYFVYKVTYLPLILLPVFLLLVYYAYSFATRKVSISRKVVPLHVSENSTTFKVTIKIKNLARVKLKDVRVKEYILPFVKKIGSYGTLHPRQISDLTGKKLLWQVNELVPKGELIITYQFQTSLAILGRIMIPGTNVEYRYKGKKSSANGRVSVFATGKKIITKR